MKRLLRRWGPYVLGALLLLAASWFVGSVGRGILAIGLAVLALHSVRRRWWDVFLGGVLTVALLAVALAVTLRIDLGPAARGAAERAGSTFLKRPLHIGRLGIHLWSGRFVIEEVRVEGLKPADEPWLTAQRITVAMPWWTIVTSRHVLINAIEMTDWKMRVELFPDGRHNFPNVTPAPSSGPRRFRVTVVKVTAARGEFTYVQHGTWSTIAPNLNVQVVNSAGKYHGIVSSSGGTVQIKDYLPMQSAMSTPFRIENGKVLLDHLVLDTDAAHTEGSGEVDVRHWPEMIYRLTSDVDLERGREIFFTREPWRVRGLARWTGTFHLFKGGRELKGEFRTDLAHVNAFDFDHLRGSLVWTPDRFEVQEASSGLYGGQATFTYSLAPLDRPVPTQARFDAAYTNVDLERFMDGIGVPGLRLLGIASGRNALEWPLGSFKDRRGEGQIAALPPPGLAVIGPSPLPEEEAAAPLEPEARAELSPRLHVRRIPVGGEVTYRLGPEFIEIDPSHLATPRTYVGFSGRTAYGDDSSIQFFTRSIDWQESDDFFASTLTAFGSPTGTIRLGGRGIFRGMLLGAFRDPRIEGTFDGDRVRAWDVVWGRAHGQAVIEHGYVDVTGGVITKGDAEARVDGRFSLSFPRKDQGEELNARIRMSSWELVDLRHAFELDDYDFNGRVSGEYHLYGPYLRPFGFGQMTIDPASAYGEPFDSATGALRFEGTGVRVDGLRILKGGGLISGAAWVEWDGRYSLNADGQRVPVESINLLQFPQAPLSGMADFTFAGAATFEHPRYELRGRIDDLFLKDEGVGQTTVRLNLDDELMSVEIEAASPRLQISGSGRVALVKAADADLTFRFTDTSLDPYARAILPGLSPFTTARASGTLRFVGQLANPDRLLVSANVEQLDLRLFDYRLQNEGPIQVDLDQLNLRVIQCKMVGENTRLQLSGSADLAEQRVSATLRGDANLAVLQGFFRDIRSSGRAEIIAEVRGTLDRPSVAGFATVNGGRIRHLQLPHSIENINGLISFGSRGIWFDDVSAKIGLGDQPVQFGGRVELIGLTPGQLSVTANGDDIVLRLADGVRATLDADLGLVGTVNAPTLRGTVLVKSARWTKQVDLSSGVIALAAARAAQGTAQAATQAGSTATAVPVQFDVRVRAPSALHLDSNVARVDASADLTLRGTLDRPLLFGRAEIERGVVYFEGRRYVVVPGGSIDFNNRTRIEPEFNLSAETRVRAPGQVYMVTLALVGTLDRLGLHPTSDPPLAPAEIYSLLLADAAGLQDVELRKLQDPAAAGRELALSTVARGGMLVTGPIASEVERMFGLDTFQIRPSLGLDPYQRLRPGARLTIGKRISDRAYVTYSRSLDASVRDDVILIEYDQSDRLSWILSQNEDRTYAIEVRVRRAF